jgi:hypothetical protein
VADKYAREIADLRREERELVEECAHFAGFIRQQQEIEDRTRGKYAKLKDPVKLAHLFGLATEPHTPGIPWFPFTPKSPYTLMRNFLREETGKDKAIFGPRGMGKTTIALMLSGEDIIEDHDFTLRIAGAAKSEVETRCNWIRQELESLEPEYGPFRTGNWSKKSLTVVRSAGIVDATVTLTSPDSPGTGSHPRRFLIDDLVDDNVEKSQADMERGVEFLKEIGCQEMEGTTTWVLGTFRHGWNAYNYIIEKLEGGLRLKKHGCGWIHRGKIYDILVFRDVDEKGNPIFPCHSKEYLERKIIRVGKRTYATQFRLLLGGDEELCFHPSDIMWGDVPEDQRTITKIIVDLAHSTSGARHTSMSSIAAWTKTPDDHAYLREMRLGQIDPTEVPEIVLNMWKRWKAVKIVYENTGPARAYMSAVRQAALRAGIDEDIVKRMFQEVGRNADKHYRMVMSQAHIEQGKLHICKSVKREIIHKDEDDQLRGTFGREYGTYRFQAPGSWDGIDNMADVWGFDTIDRPIFKAPQAPKNWKPSPDPAKNWVEYTLSVRSPLSGKRGVD